MTIEDELLTNEGSIFLGQRRAGGVENCNDYPVPSETRPSLKEAAIATVALAALSVSSSDLISIAVSGKSGRYWRRYLGMKKSSIGGKQYLDYL